MAKAPITVVWASTTSNKETLDTTRQGNGIVFESDIVSNFVNSALYLNSQATRNLQVMGGYYDGGQEYKNYQYCSQIEFVGGEYVLNYYMATQDNPTLAPTNATTYQQGTTDMEIPTNGSSVQSGWQQLNTVPNQSNIAYKNKQNTFTEKQTLQNGASITNLYVEGSAQLMDGAQIGRNNSSTLTVASNAVFSGDVTMNGNSTIGDASSDTCVINANTTISNLRSATLASNGVFHIAQKCTMRRGIGDGGVMLFDPTASTQDKENSLSIDWSDVNYSRIEFLRDTGYQDWHKAVLQFSIYSNESDSNQDLTKAVGIYYSKSVGAGVKLNNTITLGFNPSNSNGTMKFFKNTTIGNAQFGTVTRGVDPAWEQDYATANYVNQKLQELFDYLDTRLATIENKLGISNAKSRARGGIDARAMINNIEVPKSKIAELFDRLENLEGYEGVLGYSNAEERMELYKSKDNEEAVMQVMDSIKARMEQEAKEREAQEAQQNQEVKE